MGRLEELLERHSRNSISQDERQELHSLLREKYKFGDSMPEYSCPRCKKPLVLTYSLGPACWLEMGCGFRYGKVS